MSSKSLGNGLDQRKAVDLQDGAPKIVQLPYKWLNSMVYGRYNDINYIYIFNYIYIVNGC